ncbi:MAG: hypothetical protein ACXACY_24700 [Candidatus Hodarchaeales archaeon]|jgi:hypothetical protein
MHHKQNCDGRLDKTYGEDSDDLKTLELEANEAGYLVREFEDGRKSKSLKEEDTQPTNQPSSATQTDDAVGLAEPATQTGTPASYDYEAEYRNMWFQKWKKGEIEFIKNREQFDKFVDNAWNTYQGMMKAKEWQSETEKFAYAQLLDIVGAIPGLGAPADLLAATIKFNYARKVEQRYGMEAASMYYVDAAISLFAATVMGVALSLVWKAAMGTVRIGGAIAAGPIIGAVALAKGLAYKEAKQFLILELKKLLGILGNRLKNHPFKDKMVQATEAVIENIARQSTEELMKKVSARIAKTSAILTTDLTTVSAREAYEILAKDSSMKNAVKGLFKTMTKRTASKRIAQRAINELARPYLGQSAEQLRESAESYIRAFVSRSGSNIEPDALEILFENFSALSKEELIDIIVYFDILTRQIVKPQHAGDIFLKGEMHGLAATNQALFSLVGDEATRNVSRKALEKQARAEFKAAQAAYPAAMEEFEQQQTRYILAIAQFGEEEAIKRGYKPVKPPAPTLRDASRVLEGTKLNDFVNYCATSTLTDLMGVNEALLETELGKKYFAEALKSSGFFELLQNALEAEKVQLTKEMENLLKTGIPEKEAFKQLDKLLDKHVGKAFTKAKEKFEQAYAEAFINYTFAFRGSKQAALKTGAALTKPMSSRGILDRALSPSALIQRNILGRYVLTDGAPVMYGGQALPFLVATLIAAASGKSGFKAALKQAVRSPVYRFSSKFTSAIIASLITYNRFFKPLYPSQDDVLSGGKGKFGKDLEGNAKNANSKAKEQGKNTRETIEATIEEKERPDGYSVGPADEKEANERFKEAIKKEIERINNSKLPSDIKTDVVKELSELGKLSPKQRQKKLKEILNKLEKNIENIEKKTPKADPKKQAAKVKAAQKADTKKTKEPPKTKEKPKASKPDKEGTGKAKAGTSKVGVGDFGAGIRDGSSVEPFLRAYLETREDSPESTHDKLPKALQQLDKEVGDKIYEIYKELPKGRGYNELGDTLEGNPQLWLFGIALGAKADNPFLKLNNIKNLDVKAALEFLDSPAVQKLIPKKKSIEQYRNRVLNERYQKLLKGFTK